MQTKVCYACKLEKSVLDFYKSNVHYYQKECKQCCRERKYKWYQTESGKTSSANTKLKARFGIDLEIYNRMLDSQGHVCAICKRDQSYLGHKLAVDHDHSTGKIRALLCKACNLAIGHMEDDPERLIKAAEYLKQFEKVKGVA